MFKVSGCGRFVSLAVVSGIKEGSEEPVYSQFVIAVDDISRVPEDGKLYLRSMGVMGCDIHLEDSAALREYLMEPIELDNPPPFDYHSTPPDEDLGYPLITTSVGDLIMNYLAMTTDYFNDYVVSKN